MMSSDASYDAVLGKLIREKRVRAGLSQSGLGERIGITFQQIQKYEKGTNRVVFGRLMAISAALGVSPTDLVAEVEDRTARTTRDALTAEETNNERAELALVKASVGVPPEIQECTRQLLRAVKAATGTR